MENGDVENLALYQRERCMNMWTDASAFKYGDFNGFVAVACFRGKIMWV